jgi:hypothetical protein
MIGALKIQCPRGSYRIQSTVTGWRAEVNASQGSIGVLLIQWRRLVFRKKHVLNRVPSLSAVNTLFRFDYFVCFGVAFNSATNDSFVLFEHKIKQS